MSFDAELFLFDSTLFQQEIQPAIVQTLASHHYPASLDVYAQGIYEMQRRMNPDNSISDADLAPAVFASAVFDFLCLLLSNHRFIDSNMSIAVSMDRTVIFTSMLITTCQQ